MSTIFNYNLTTDFNNGINFRYLKEEIIRQITVPFVSSIFGDTLEFTFDNSLSSPEQIILDDIIANHDPNETLPMTITTTLAPNDTYIIDHFLDKSNERNVVVKNDAIDTYDDLTYKLNNNFSGDYNISNTNAELNQTAFLLKATSYAEGADIAVTGTATASSSQNPATNGNDNDVATIWYNANGQAPVGSWWQVELPQILGVFGVEIVWFSTTYYSTDITVEYSNDNINWNTAIQDTGIGYTSTGAAAGTYKFASFSSPIFAKFFRFTFNQAQNVTYVVVREFHLFGADGSGFPIASDASISNIKANRQIDTSGWALINSSTINGNFPTNTTTRILLSYDDQTTWKLWDGSVWTVATLANINTNGMTPDVFNALTSTDYASTGGLNSDTMTLDIAINIVSTDTVQSPIIDNFTFNLDTNTFLENINDSSVRIRYISPTKTEIKNITSEIKVITATIY